MSLIGGNPAVVNTHTKGDTSKLPMDLSVTNSRLSSMGRIVVGPVLAWLGYGMIGANSGVLAGVPFGETLVLVSPLIIAGFGLVLLTQGVFRLNHRIWVHIENGMVEAKAMSILGSDKWTEPLAAYQGVRWRELVVQSRLRVGGNNTTGRNMPRIYQVLDLYHTDPTRCIPLYVTRLRENRGQAFSKLNEIMQRSDEARDKLGSFAVKIDDLQVNTRSRWEGIATVLGVPTIDARDGKQEVRAAADIDKSIRELADEGKIDAEWDGRPPPAGLDLAYLGGDNASGAQEISVTILARKFPIWLYAGLFLLFGFLFLNGLFQMELVLIVFGGLIAAGTVWHWKSETKNPRSVRITRSQLLINTPNPGNASKSNTVAHTAIESVTISSRNSQSSFGLQLVVATDREEFKIGLGLSKEALEWLRELILSAVAKA